MKAKGPVAHILDDTSLYNINIVICNRLSPISSHEILPT